MILSTAYWGGGDTVPLHFRGKVFDGISFIYVG